MLLYSDIFRNRVLMLHGVYLVVIVSVSFMKMTLIRCFVYFNVRLTHTSYRRRFQTCHHYGYCSRFGF
jgi:hypothetical protein